MKIVIVINFSRSGGTLLARILGSFPNVVLASEINPLLGSTPDSKKAVSPALALKEQMKVWYGIDLYSNNFLDALTELQRYCQEHKQQLIVRDWTHLDFRKVRLNNWNPSGELTLVNEVQQVIGGNIEVFVFVRDAIDVFLSSNVELDQFSIDYLSYVKKIIELGAPIIKYEDLVENPETTIKKICDIVGLEFSQNYKRFHKNIKVTGDIQLGQASRGMREQAIAIFPRKWVPKTLQKQINSNKDLSEANHLLGYSPQYSNGDVETLIQMIKRQIQKQFSKFMQVFK